MSFRKVLSSSPSKTTLLQKRKTESDVVQADDANVAKVARNHNEVIVKRHYDQFDVPFRYIMTVEDNHFSETVTKLIEKYNRVAANTNHKQMAEQLNEFLEEFHTLDEQTITGSNNKLAIRIMKLLVQDILEIKLYEHTVMSPETEIGRLKRRGPFVEAIFNDVSEIRKSMLKEASCIFRIDTFFTRYRNLRMNNMKMLKRAEEAAGEIDNVPVVADAPIAPPVIVPAPEPVIVAEPAAEQDPAITAGAMKETGAAYVQLRTQHAQLEARRNRLARKARAAINNLDQQIESQHAQNETAIQTLQAKRQKANAMGVADLLSPEELNSIPEMSLPAPAQLADVSKQADQLADDLLAQEKIQQTLASEIDVRITECKTALQRQQDYLAQRNNLETVFLPENTIAKIEEKMKALNPATLFARIQTGSEQPVLQVLVETYQQLKQQSEEGARKVAEKSASIEAKTKTLEAKNLRFQGLFNDYSKQVDELKKALQVTRSLLAEAKQERPDSPSLRGLSHE